MYIYNYNLLIINTLLLEQYMEEIKSLINDDNLTVIDEGYHEWKVNNWDEFIKKKTNNEFIINGRIW